MNNTSYNPGSSRFILAHNGDKEARTCFYINKRIDSNSWGVEFRNNNLCSLQIKVTRVNLAKRSDKTQQRDLVWIYNIYNPSPASYISTDSPLTILDLIKAIEEEGKHIIIGDFNLYYPIQNNLGRFIYHAIADRLLEVIAVKNIELGLSEKLTTWHSRGYESAIDLVFLLEKSFQMIARCEVRTNLDYGSDHQLIEIELEQV